MSSRYNIASRLLAVFALATIESRDRCRSTAVRSGSRRL